MPEVSPNVWFDDCLPQPQRRREIVREQADVAQVPSYFWGVRLGGVWYENGTDQRSLPPPGRTPGNAAATDIAVQVLINAALANPADLGFNLGTDHRKISPDTPPPDRILSNRLPAAALHTSAANDPAFWAPLLLNTDPVPVLVPSIGLEPARRWPPAVVREGPPSATDPPFFAAVAQLSPPPSALWPAPVRLPVRPPEFQPTQVELWPAAQVLVNAHTPAFAFQPAVAPLRQPAPFAAAWVPAEAFGPIWYDNLVPPGDPTIAAMLGSNVAGIGYGDITPHAHAWRIRDWPRLRYRNPDNLYLSGHEFPGLSWQVQVAELPVRLPTSPAIIALSIVGPPRDPGTFDPLVAGFALAWDSAIPQVPVRLLQRVPYTLYEYPAPFTISLHTDSAIWSWPVQAPQMPVIPARWRPDGGGTDTQTVQVAVDYDIDRLARPAWMFQAPGPVRRAVPFSAAVVAAADMADSSTTSIPPVLIGDFATLTWFHLPQYHQPRAVMDPSVWAETYAAPSARSSGALVVAGPYCMVESEVYQPGAVAAAVVCGGPESRSAIYPRQGLRERWQRMFHLYATHTATSDYPWRVIL